MLVSVEYYVSYGDLVTVNDNVLRVFPSEYFWQKPIDEKVTIEPKGKIVYYNDRFGNRSARVRITEPHQNSVFKVVSTVETTPYKVTVEKDMNLPLNNSLIPSETRMYLTRRLLSIRNSLDTELQMF